MEDTQAIYAKWAGSYDADVLAAGYVTPHRIAVALVAQGLDPQTPILDFGCGTGLSGAALAEAGFQVIDGTDISAAMLDQAHARGVYRDVVLGDPGAIAFEPQSHPVVVAAGVVSAGAAPPDTLDMLLNHVPSGGLVALSFNDPSLEMGTYDAQLETLVAAGAGTVIFREHGPHLPAKDMESDVILLRKA